MGDIKKIRKKYSKPAHPWRASRIEEENAIGKEYGIPRKTEIWKAIAEMESFKNQTKKLSTLNSKQAIIEKENLIKRLQSLNLIKAGESSDVILGITLKDVLNRRLQTIVFKKGLAATMRQARQMITHRHILINNKILTSPGYLVRISEETQIEVSPKSPFYGADHPERVKAIEAKNKPAKEEKKDDRKDKRISIKTKTEKKINYKIKI